MRFSRWAASMGLTAIIAAAIPVPELNLKNLTSDSDVILVGIAQAVENEGATSIVVNGERVRAHRFRATIAPRQIIKGEVGDSVTVAFDLPDQPLGFEGVPINQVRLFFLKGETGFRFTSPYYPSVPAEGVSASKRASLDVVIACVLRVISSGREATDRRLEAVEAVRSTTENREEVLSTMHRALRALGVSPGDQLLRLAILVDLVRRNDTSVLPLVAPALRNKSVPQYASENLIYAIPKLSDPKATEFLSSLLHNPDVRVRRAAAQALRNSGSRAAIQPLVAALSDPDLDVQYFGVIGLGEITGQGEWRPLEEEFKAAPQRYTEHWRNWARLQSGKQ